MKHLLLKAILKFCNNKKLINNFVCIVKVTPSIPQRSVKESITIALTMISVMGLCWVFIYIPLLLNKNEPNGDTTTIIDVINWIFVVLATFQVVLNNFFLLQIKFYLEIYCFECESKMV